MELILIPEADNVFVVLIFYYVSFDFLATDISLKRSDDENLSSKDWRAYITTLAADFLVIVLPTILFLTVSLLLYLRKLLIGANVRLRRNTRCYPNLFWPLRRNMLLSKTIIWTEFVLLLLDHLWE